MAKQDQQSEYMSNVIGNAGENAAGATPQVAYTDLREWIEEARKLRSTVQTRAEQTIADLDARREQALELVTTQVARLADVAAKPLGFAQRNEVRELSARVTDLAEKLADVERQLASLQKDAQQAA